MVHSNSDVVRRISRRAISGLEANYKFYLSQFYIYFTGQKVLSIVDNVP